MRDRSIDFAFTTSASSALLFPFLSAYLIYRCMALIMILQIRLATLISTTPQQRMAETASSKVIIFCGFVLDTCFFIKKIKTLVISYKYCMFFFYLTPHVALYQIFHFILTDDFHREVSATITKVILVHSFYCSLFFCQIIFI